MLERHQLVPMLGHVEESETAKKIATIRDFHDPGAFFCSSSRLLHFFHWFLNLLLVLMLEDYSNQGL